MEDSSTAAYRRKKLEEACEEMTKLYKTKYLDEYLSASSSKKDSNSINSKSLNIFDILSSDEYELRLRVARKEDMHEVYCAICELSRMHKVYSFLEEDEIRDAGFADENNPKYFIIVLELKLKDREDKVKEQLNENQASNEFTHFFSVEENKQDGNENSMFVDMNDVLDKYKEYEKKNLSAPSSILIGYSLLYFSFSTLDGPLVYMEDLYVNKYFRNGNFGLILMRCVVYYAYQKMQIKSLSWSAIDFLPNKTFYKRCGGREVDIFDNLYFGKSEIENLINI